MTAEQAAAAWSTLETPTEPARNEPAFTKPRKHYKPFSAAADAFVHEAQNTKRFYTGIRKFDDEMRGISPGHLALIVGYSHSGKTLLLLEMLRSNPKARIAWWEPDEPNTLTLAKLASLVHGIPARELEQKVAQGDKEAISLLRSVAEEHFPNLIVFDKSLTPSALNDGYKEACDVWGDSADITIVDYVDLVMGAEVVPQKMDILKSFVSHNEVGMIAIHQTSRSGGAEGREMTISSGNYGGEQHATMMIGVRRKKAAIMSELIEVRGKLLRNPNSEALNDRREELAHDLRIHEYTLSANLVKNKRPGGSLVDEIDFEMDLSTGRLYELDDGDLPQQYLNTFGAPAEPAPASYEQEAF